MKTKDQLYVVIGLLLLAFATLACGSSNEGTVITPEVREVAEDQSESESASELGSESTESEEGAERLETEVDEAPEEPAPTQDLEEASEETDVAGDASGSGLEMFEIGDLVEVEEHQIRLNSVAYEGDVLVANFTIENMGSSDLNVSSLLSFSAKRGDGTLLDQEFFDCGTSGLDGSVLPNDLIRGDICWSGANPEDEIRLYYGASLFGQGAVIWSGSEGIAENAEPSSERSEIETFQVGDLVQVQDHTIRLNELTYDAGIMTADFSIENTGASEINISSILLFTARKGDGTSLEQEIFDCGSSGLEGKVLGGDRLRGEICWSGATPEDGIRIFYEADWLGEGAVVWDAIAGVAEARELSDPTYSFDTFGVGEPVEADGQTITLNSIDILGNVVKANFTVQNTGVSDIELSSILSFYARLRDGTSLEQEIFDCGTSLDGSVVPNDILTGDICWSGVSSENSDGLKVYYEPELFSRGAVVWTVE